MTKKMHTLIPKPRSSFLRVACPKCGKETVLFSHTTRDLRCKSCDELIAEKSGSRAILHSEKSEKLDQS